MKNKRILGILGVGLLMMFVGFANADGNQGDPCVDPSDCSYPLACHNEICNENCYSHEECGETRFNEYEGSFCGPLNICAYSFWDIYDSDGPVTHDDVCPECELAPYSVCSGQPHDYFVDNLDNDAVYCHIDYCSHLGVIYPNNDENYNYYLPDKENLFYCTGQNNEVGSWSSPACEEGYVWDVNKYGVGPFDYPLPAEGCILAPLVAPEFPLLFGAVLMLLSPGFAYVISKRHR